MPPQYSYTPNYFSIDDILATQERIPCQVLVHVPKLGKLNQSSEERDLTVGTSLDLPYWIVMPLSQRRQPILSARLPKIYSESYREILKADPCAVELPKFNVYFYELGSYCKVFDPRGDLGLTLVYTFIARFRKLMDLAENIISNAFIHEDMDMLERSLYLLGHKARTKLNSWLEKTGMQLEAASMVTNHKKRRRAELDDFDF